MTTSRKVSISVVLSLGNPSAYYYGDFELENCYIAGRGQYKIWRMLVIQGGNRWYTLHVLHLDCRAWKNKIVIVASSGHCCVLHI